MAHAWRGLAALARPWSSWAVARLGLKHLLQMFFRESAACLEKGFTRLALKYPEQPQMLGSRQGGLRRVGGLAQTAALEVGRTCLPRMRAWTRLACEVVDVEFPDFEFLVVFSACGMECKVVLRTPQPHHNRIASCVERLSRACPFGTDRTGLMDQFLDHRSVSETVMLKKPDLPAQVVRHSSVRWPADALLPILLGFLVRLGSTAGIKQAFNKCKR